MEGAAKEGVGHWFDGRTLAQRLLLKKGRCQTWGVESEGPHSVAVSICVLRDWSIESRRRYRSQRDRLDLELPM